MTAKAITIESLQEQINELEREIETLKKSDQDHWDTWREFRISQEKIEADLKVLSTSMTTREDLALISRSITQLEKLVTQGMENTEKKVRERVAIKVNQEEIAKEFGTFKESVREEVESVKESNLAIRDFVLGNETLKAEERKSARKDKIVSFLDTPLARSGYRSLVIVGLVYFGSRLSPTVSALLSEHGDQAGIAQLLATIGFYIYEKKSRKDKGE